MSALVSVGRLAESGHKRTFRAAALMLLCYANSRSVETLY